MQPLCHNSHLDAAYTPTSDLQPPPQSPSKQFAAVCSCSQDLVLTNLECWPHSRGTGIGAQQHKAAV